MAKRAVSLSCLLGGLIALAASHAQAQSRPFAPLGPQPDLTVDVGLGAVYGFSATGTNPYQVNPAPWVSINYKNKIYANDFDGIGYNAIDDDRLRMGLQVRPKYPGLSTIPGIKAPGLGWNAAPYAYYRLPGDTIVGARLTRDISDITNGTEVRLSAEREDKMPFGILNSTLYATAGDDHNNRAYWGVSPLLASKTGFDPYDPGAGGEAVGVSFLILVPFMKDYGIGSLFNVERAIGRVADSPVIDARVDKQMAYRVGLLVIRRFDLSSWVRGRP